MNGRDLAIFYYKEWRKKYGEPYSPSWAKHTAIFKRLLAAGHHCDSLCDYIAFYLSGYGDPFAAKTGHSIEHFASALPAIISAIRELHKRRDAGAVGNPDFEAVAAARKQNE